MVKIRKKSPRAPSIGLEEAVKKAIAVYQKEGKHEIPADLAAQDMGYSGKSSGSALGALAALKAYGLLDAPKPGQVAVNGSVEEYLYVPDESEKKRLLRDWAKNPPLFEELLSTFSDRKPSDGALKHQLIKFGFTPQGLDPVVKSFNETIDYCDFYGDKGYTSEKAEDHGDALDREGAASTGTTKGTLSGEYTAGSTQGTTSAPTNVDRIPVRLKGGRRAWIEIPVPFFEEDKEVIKAQIEVIVTDEPDEPDIDDLV